MCRRHQPARFLRVEVEGAGAIEEADKLGRGSARSPPRHDERTLGAPQRLDRLGDRRRVRRDTPRTPRPHPLLEHEAVGHVGAQDVGWDLEIDGAWLAHVAEGAADRLVELSDHLVGDAQSAGSARHRPQNVDVRDVLQRPHVDLRARRAAADQQHWRAGQRSVGDGRHRVRHARPGRDHGDAERACQLRVRVCHVHGRTFVAHVDDADTEPAHVIPDRLYVAALKAEHPVDAARLQEPGDQRRDGARSRPEVRCGAGLVCHGSSSQLFPPIRRSRNRRCWILPVAVRGIWASAMTAAERGRL